MAEAFPSEPDPATILKDVTPYNHKSILWSAFSDKKGVKYLSDQTHACAWCNGCVREWVRAQKEQDLLNRVSGIISELRSEAVLWEAALVPSLAILNKEQLRSMGKINHNVTDAGVIPVCGKRTTMTTHIKHCKYVPEADRKLLLARLDPSSAQSAQENVTHTFGFLSHPPAPPQALHTPSTAYNTPIAPAYPPHSRKRPRRVYEAALESTSCECGCHDGEASRWTAERQHQFEDDMCRLFAACGFSWNAADNPETHRFFARWVPGARVPDRRKLSGLLLKAAASRVKEKVVERVKGKLATGQCDGWKNVAKTPVISSLMTVERQPQLVHTNNMTGEPKTGDRLFELIQEDMKLMTNDYFVEVIAWVTDDGPDGKKARRLLREKFPHLITTVCWAHQINLIVGDYLKGSGSIETINRALEVVKWFNNHSQALDLFKAEQEFTYEDSFTRALVLILPIITRWTAHYLSVHRLLLLSEAMKTCCTRRRSKLLVAAGTKHEQMEKAEEILETVADESFWSELTQIESHLEPLAIAANVTQAPYTRLDHVLLTLANLYRLYRSTSPRVRTTVHDSLEKRWKNADQDVYILALFLNPYVRSQCFNGEVLSTHNIITIAKRVFTRFFGEEPSTGFTDAIIDYRDRAAEYSNESMHLDDWKRSAELEEKDLDVVSIWKSMNYTPGKVSTGRAGLVHTAVRVLSVIANSSGSERSFSDFGILHTRRRSRLDSDNVHDTSVVRSEVRREQAELGLTSGRFKRAFGPTPSQLGTGSVASQGAAATPPHPPVMDDEDHGEDVDFTEVGQQLVDDANLSLLEPPEDIRLTATSTTGPQQAAAAPPVQSTSSAQTSRTPARGTGIPLALLFIYPDDTVPPGDMAFYWHGGIRNLDTERAGYDLAHSSRSK